MRDPSRIVRQPYPFKLRAGEVNTSSNPSLDVTVRWGEYYWASSEMLTSELGHDVCDCFRGIRNFTEGANEDLTEKTRADVDNRFLTIPQLDVALTYFRWLDETTPFQGHWHPRMGGLPHLDCTPGRCDGPLKWEVDMYTTMENSTGTLLRDTILELRPPPTHIVFGARWPHMPLVEKHLVRFMDLANKLVRNTTFRSVPRLIWKSDIQAAPVHGMARSQAIQNARSIAYMTIAADHGWSVIDQVNLTRRFSPDCYNDVRHLNEVARTQLNELLVSTLMSIA